jgi:AcrR family transcriptional regulator
MTGREGALRADAERNRRRVLDAARELFARDGLDVSLRQIARHAGVSEPTLRRRFPDRESLVADAFQDKIGEYAAEAERALDGAASGDAFASFLRRAAGMQLVDRGFGEVLALTFTGAQRAEQERVRAYRAVAALIERAQRSGVLRADFTPEDVVMVLMAHAGIVAAAGPVADAFSARLLEYLLQSFARLDGAPLPPSPSPSRTYRALQRLARETPADS